MKVELFIPCFVDQVYPATAFNMVKVLEKCGCEVNYNTNQTCCGQPAFNAGFRDEAKEVCVKFIKDFEGALKAINQCLYLSPDYPNALALQSDIKNYLSFLSQ